jgi:NAD(P)H-dependent flavin oxidoreductase YrpB (nitropropane dioxygenase family)
MKLQNLFLKLIENYYWKLNKLRPTVLTRAYTGKPARGIRTAITDHFHASNDKKTITTYITLM